MMIPVGRLRARNHRAAGRKMSAMAMIPTVKTSPAHPLTGILCIVFRDAPESLLHGVSRLPPRPVKRTFFQTAHYLFPTLVGVPTHKDILVPPAPTAIAQLGNFKTGRVNRQSCVIHNRANGSGMK
jgi:hypothetical protein